MICTIETEKRLSFQRMLHLLGKPQGPLFSFSVTAAAAGAPFPLEGPAVLLSAPAPVSVAPSDVVVAPLFVVAAAAAATGSCVAAPFSSPPCSHLEKSTFATCL